MINLRFPHRGTASLAQVSTMGLCPLLKKETIQKEPCDSTGYTHALTCPQKDNKGTRNKNTRNNCMKDTHTHVNGRVQINKSGSGVSVGQWWSIQWPSSKGIDDVGALELNQQGGGQLRDLIEILLFQPLPDPGELTCLQTNNWMRWSSRSLHYKGAHLNPSTPPTKDRPASV